MTNETSDGNWVSGAVVPADQPVTMRPWTEHDTALMLLWGAVVIAAVVIAWAFGEPPPPGPPKPPIDPDHPDDGPYPPTFGPF